MAIHRHLYFQYKKRNTNETTAFIGGRKAIGGRVKDLMTRWHVWGDRGFFFGTFFSFIYGHLHGTADVITRAVRFDLVVMAGIDRLGVALWRSAPETCETCQKRKTLDRIGIVQISRRFLLSLNSKRETKTIIRRGISPENPWGKSLQLVRTRFSSSSFPAGVIWTKFYQFSLVDEDEPRRRAWGPFKNDQSPNGKEFVRQQTKKKTKKRGTKKAPWAAWLGKIADLMDRPRPSWRPFIFGGCRRLRTRCQGEIFSSFPFHRLLISPFYRP